MNSIFKKVAVAGALALSLGFSAQAASLGTLSGTTTISTPPPAAASPTCNDFSVTPNAGAGFVSSAITFSSYGASLSSLALYLGTYTSFAQLTGMTPLAASTSTTITTWATAWSSTRFRPRR